MHSFSQHDPPRSQFQNVFLAPRARIVRGMCPITVLASSRGTSLDHPMKWRLAELKQLYNAQVDIGPTTTERLGADEGEQFTIAEGIRVSFPNGLYMLMKKARLKQLDGGGEVAFATNIALSIYRLY